MGIVIRQSSISTALTFIGIGLGYLNVLYFFPLYLSPDQIGLTRVIQDFAMLLVPFAQFGISQATLKFYPTFTKRDESSGFLTLMILMALSGFILFFIVFNLMHGSITQIFSSRSPEVNNYLYLVIILVFILVIFNVITDFSRSLLKIVAPNFLREVFLRLLTTCSIFLYFLKVVDFDGFLLCIVGSYFLNLVILIGFLTLKGDFRINFNFSRFVSPPEIRGIIKYAFFALLGASSAIIIAKIDSVMITSLISTYANGIYTTAFYMAVVIEIPRRMIAQISTPLIARGLEEKNFEKVNTIYRKASLNQLIIGGLLFIGLWANLENIYSFVPNNDVYILGKWVVVIIGFAKLVDMSAGLNGEIIILSEYYKTNIIFTGALALLLFTSNLILIPLYGIIGAAYGTTISLILFNSIKFVYIKRKMGFQPFRVNNLKVVLIGCLVLAFALLIPRISNPLIDIVARSILITIVYSFLIIATKSSEDINELYAKAKSIIFRRQ
jgi:O-antigen/teichoic acid export membrane protein